MKHLSHWANRHARPAIALLIGCELVNGFGAVVLGADALNDLPLPTLMLLTGFVVTGAVGLRSGLVAQRVGTTYRAKRWRLAAAFGSNYLLFMLLGAYWGHTVQTPSTDGVVWGSRRVVVRSDTLIKPADTVRKPVVVRDADGYIISRSGVSRADADEKSRRFGYVMLFILGFALTYVSAGLACGIACSGYGALAVLTFALGLGFLAGGVYFLGRATERPFVPLPEQPIAQRRRTVRRFWLSWLILIGIFGISLLTCSR